MYIVGDVTGDDRFTFESASTGEKPMDLAMSDMFGSSPKTIMIDTKINRVYEDLSYSSENVQEYIRQVLKLEAVACKDWLTNKVDRCVGGLVAKQQTAGALQLPLNNCGVMALDYYSGNGIATSIGHSPISGLIDPVAGAQNSIAEALTNIVFAPLEDGLTSVSLSANWMWPCRNEGEDARLYEAVKAISEFSIALGINVPTGKDSLSMKQKYKDEAVIAPGTVVISAGAQCSDIMKIVEPVLQIPARGEEGGGAIYYINFSKMAHQLGGSSFAQVQNKIGANAPAIADAAYFGNAFNTIQELIKDNKILAGHDISAGGMLTALLEMCFAEQNVGANIDLSAIDETDIVKILFAENSGILIQARDISIENTLSENGVDFYKIGTPTESNILNIKNQNEAHAFDIAELRDTWYETSHLLDQRQTANGLATQRFDNYKHQPLQYQFPTNFSGKRPIIDASKPRPKAAILREKGSNSERELANALYIAGFDVKDVHTSDLMAGRETLEDVQFLGAVGGFSNSDVLGSAKGWAGALLYNEKARTAIENFFKRDDVLSIGICNGCQLFLELGLINPNDTEKSLMLHNSSQKHECQFTSVAIEKNNSVMLSSFAGSKLGIWISHGEGKFHLPLSQDNYNIVATYGYDSYPANPNGSDYNAAMIVSEDGRHLATMPHLERSTFQWNWANYPNGREDEVSPWVDAFVNARVWIENLEK